MKVRLTVERGDYNAQITTGNESFVVECYLADISQVPPAPTPPNPNVVDTGAGNITSDKVFKGFKGYAKGVEIVGEFEQNNPNIVDTSTADITPDDVVLGKTGFAQGQEITGTLDVQELITEAYESGQSDILDSQADGNITANDVRTGKVGFAANNTKIVGALNPFEYQKDPLWWDIYNILLNDNTPDYVAKMGVLICDEWLYSEMSGADAYRTSDGAFYEVENKNTLVRHNWQPSSYKEDSKGYKTKYVIRYYKTNAVVSPAFGNTTVNSMGSWPIGIVCKNGVIPAGGFLQNNYSVQFYDHINCVYTGTTLNGFLGSGNNYCLQSVPESYNFTGNIVTFGSAFQSKTLRKLDVSSVDFSNLNPVSFAGFFNGMFLLEEVTGVIDCEKATAIGTMFNNSYMLKRFVLRNVRHSLTFVSSVIEYETLRDLIVNGLLPAVGQTLKLAGSYYALTDDLKAIAAANGWTVTI